MFNAKRLSSHGVAHPYLFKGGATPWLNMPILAKIMHENEKKNRKKFEIKIEEKREKNRKEKKRKNRKHEMLVQKQIVMC